ncbi:hypothetical protein GCM10011320_39160 [Neoroseomonas lacus]|uniref:Uncharacterized protein n=1 Tax=Neoroseomonas lacus TaxID=287609 RepID=A0A917KU75_9PROT|nr:hypothetical protein GCM10011320_39160 [Neoroseomonas lacus]
MMRAGMSVVPPGAKGTMMRVGRLGQAPCAKDGRAMAMAAVVSSALRGSPMGRRRASRSRPGGMVFLRGA